MEDINDRTLDKFTGVQLTVPRQEDNASKRSAKAALRAQPSPHIQEHNSSQPVILGQLDHYKRTARARTPVRELKIIPPLSNKNCYNRELLGVYFTCNIVYDVIEKGSKLHLLD